MGLFKRDEVSRPSDEPPPQKPEGGVCKRCGQHRLVFFDDGSGECKNCHRIFRWDDRSNAQPGAPPQQYGRYDQYSPGNASPHGYRPPYPADQSYGGRPVQVPTEGQCADCGCTDLVFHQNGRGECQRCGRVFDWLSKEDSAQPYKEEYFGQGLYQTSEDMIYALDTGTKPEFIFAELIRQGRTPREANRIVNRALDEYERRQMSKREYLNSMIRDFESNGVSGFQRTGGGYYDRRSGRRPYQNTGAEPMQRPRPRPRPRSEPERVVYVDFDDEDEEEEEEYVDDDDDEPEVYIELDEEDDEVASVEDFGLEFEEAMGTEDEDEDDVKLGDGRSVTLPKNSQKKEKKRDAEENE